MSRSISQFRLTKQALEVTDLKSLSLDVKQNIGLVFCLLTLVTWFICFIDHTLLLLYLCCLSFTMFCVQLLYVQLIYFSDDELSKLESLDYFIKYGF